MAKINYLLRSKIKNQPATFTLRFYHGKKIDYSIATNFFAYPDTWSNKLQTFNWRSIKGGEKVRLMKMHSEMTELKSKILLGISGKSQPTRKQIAKIIYAFLNPNQTQNEINLNNYIEWFISEMENGTRLTAEKKRYKIGTTKNYRTFQNIFSEYQIETNIKLDFEHITIDFYDKFIQFLTQKKYTPNTIGRHIKHLKAIMRGAMEEGYHKNTEFQRKRFKAPTNKTTDIYLTESELKQLYKLELSGIYDVARDLFLIGCYTAQRYSDYSSIKPENINGNFIHLYQQKTGAEVVIPMRPEVKAILKKYDYNLPKTYVQKINDRIKHVGKLARIDEPVLIEKINGGMKIKTTVPKYEMIKTHTGRRSGATNMYLAGIPTIAIMKITGHKTEREFLKYIKVSSEETANNLITHPFFTQKTLKIAK